MKTRPLSGLLLLAAGLTMIIVACRKSSAPEEKLSIPGPDPQIITDGNCPGAPDYGSSVICPKWKGPVTENIIKPLNNPGSGTYCAWPQGLVIDAATGEINVSKSETGVRYRVGFVKAGTNDTCSREIILGGITYIDSIYVLSENDTLAFPYFNADPAGTSVCGGSDDTDYPPSGNPNAGGNDRCEFDDGNDDDNGNGMADEPPAGQRANDQHVRVRTTSGIINLKRSLEEGAFGTNPQNGDSKEVTIYYRLNDCSSKALQKIRVRLIYYHKRSDVPDQLANDIAAKRSNFLESRLVSIFERPRPPQIIITRMAE